MFCRPRYDLPMKIHYTAALNKKGLLLKKKRFYSEKCFHFFLALGFRINRRGFLKEGVS